MCCFLRSDIPPHTIMGAGATSKPASWGTDLECQVGWKAGSKVDGACTTSPVIRLDGGGVDDAPLPLQQARLSASASSVAEAPTPQLSSLAARRAAQGKIGGGLPGLSVYTDKVNPRRMVLGQLQRASDNTAAPQVKIEKTDAFDKLYAIGAEVMPSVHPGMEIRHAMKLQDASRVVVKIRKKANSFASPQEEREWRQSAEFMLNLPTSSSIAGVYGVWEDKDAYYVVMERVGGSDLFELLDAEGMLPLGESKAILKQLLRGVGAMHDKGCIHKDLKLENVMVDRMSLKLKSGEEPVVKLIDFDTAQSWEPSSPKAKTVLGTDQYISAEAYAGNYSPASDMFAVGVIAYKLITGHFPFNSKMFDDEAGENWVGSPKMKQIQQRVVRAKINFGIAPFPSDPEAEKFVRGLLAPNDEDRMSVEEALEHSFFDGVCSPKASRGN